MFHMGFAELLVILIIVLIFGGYKVLPKVADSIKESLNVVKKESALEDEKKDKSE